MASWFWYAVAAAVLYGAHQVTTRLASTRVSEGLGGLVVEAAATVTIVGYLAALRLSGRWQQTATTAGVAYSLLTGVAVGLGTLAFFLLFQRGGPLSAVPAILAGGAAIMAVAGVAWFHESLTPARAAGIVLSIAGLYLVRK